MFYYIYYGYITGVTVYRLYEYWDIARKTYVTASYTYMVVNDVYKRSIFNKEKVELGRCDKIYDDWEVID